MHDPKGYYQTLGLSSSASASEIKQAYRSLMKQYHPDINDSAEAADVSGKINEAYGVLSDSELKAAYDRPEPDPRLFNIWDMFDMYGHRDRKPAKAKNSNILLEVYVQEADLFKENNIFVSYEYQNFCTACAGAGSSKTESCGPCAGRGYVDQRVSHGSFVAIQQSTCQSCHGAGDRVVELCQSCQGAGSTPSSGSIEIGEYHKLLYVPQTFVGLGNLDADPSEPRGDLRVVIIPRLTSPDWHIDPVSKRVTMDVPVDALYILTEGEVRVPGINGESMLVKIKCSLSKKYRLKEKGIPVGDGRRSDLLLSIRPEYNKVKKEVLRQEVLKYLEEVYQPNDDQTSTRSDS